MDFDRRLLFLFLICMVHSHALAHHGLEGYLLNRPQPHYDKRCMSHLGGQDHGTLNFTGDPWDQDFCDCLILEPEDESEEGNFTIRLADSGLYLTYTGHVGRSILSFNSTPSNFRVYRGGDCIDCPELTGLTSLLNESDPMLIYFDATIRDATWCLYDYPATFFYPEDYDYGYVYGYPLTHCGDGQWWFEEALCSTQETTSTPDVESTVAQDESSAMNSTQDSLDTTETVTENISSPSLHNRMILLLLSFMLAAFQVLL